MLSSPNVTQLGVHALAWKGGRMMLGWAQVQLKGQRHKLV